MHYYFSTAIVLVSVILNYIMPEGVFTLITSISLYVSFLFGGLPSSVI